MTEAEKSKHDNLVELMAGTEQFTYSCDAGCLAMFVNGTRFCVLNCIGDGEGTVYILNKNHSSAPCPLHDELIATFGWCREDEDPPIEIKFAYCDILLSEDNIIHTIRANHISISRIAGTCDFVFRCSDN